MVCLMALMCNTGTLYFHRKKTKIMCQSMRTSSYESHNYINKFHDQISSQQ